MKSTTFLLAIRNNKNPKVFLRTGGVIGSDDYIVKDRSGFTTELPNVYVKLKEAITEPFSKWDEVENTLAINTLSILYKEKDGIKINI